MPHLLYISTICFDWRYKKNRSRYRLRFMWRDPKHRIASLTVHRCFSLQGDKISVSHNIPINSELLFLWNRERAFWQTTFLWLDLVMKSVSGCRFVAKVTNISDILRLPNPAWNFQKKWNRFGIPGEVKHSIGWLLVLTSTTQALFNSFHPRGPNHSLYPKLWSFVSF